MAEVQVLDLAASPAFQASAGIKDVGDGALFVLALEKALGGLAGSSLVESLFDAPEGTLEAPGTGEAMLAVALENLAAGRIPQYVLDALVAPMQTAGISSEAVTTEDAGAKEPADEATKAEGQLLSLLTALSAAANAQAPTPVQPESQQAPEASVVIATADPEDGAQKRPVEQLPPPGARSVQVSRPEVPEFAKAYGLREGGLANALDRISARLDAVTLQGEPAAEATQTTEAGQASVQVAKDAATVVKFQVAPDAAQVQASPDRSVPAGTVRQDVEAQAEASLPPDGNAQAKHAAVKGGGVAAEVAVVSASPSRRDAGDVSASLPGGEPVDAPAPATGRAVGEGASFAAVETEPEIAQAPGGRGGENGDAVPAGEVNEPDTGALRTLQEPAQQAEARVSRAEAPEARPAGGPDQERIIARISDAIARVEKGGQSTVRIRLYPPELGTVRLEVSHFRGTVAVRMEASTPAAQNALQSNIAALRADLREAGVDVRNIEVQYRNLAAHQGPQQGRDGQHDHSAPRQPKRFRANDAVEAVEPLMHEAAAVAAGGLNVLV